MKLSFIYRSDTKLWVCNATTIFVLLYSTKMWPLGKTLESCVNGFKSHAISTIEGVNWFNFCVQWGVLWEDWPAKHPLHHHFVPCSLAQSCPATTRWRHYQSHLLVQHDIYKLATTLWQITKSLEGRHLPGHPSRSIWRWSVSGLCQDWELEGQGGSTPSWHEI